MLDDTLGRYRILESIGRGGMGQVFLAEDPALGRRVAIKVLPAEYAADPEREARLRREAQAASALNHPNIVTIYDFGTARGGPYVVMEYVEGETLDEWGRAATRSPLEVLGLLRQATRAMARAHEAGLVHRDLKPKNLMVRRDGLLKILDFGLARSLGPDAASGTALTAAGRILGTARYMSPEQALGQQPGPPSDVFSLGIILYELLTGRHPFTTGSDLVAIHGILHDSPPPPSRANPALTGTVDFVLAKVLSKDPHRRHSSAHELDVDLEALERSYQAPHSAAAVGAPAPSVLAVLPFKNIGGDSELSYLGVGLADAVITRLAHSPDLIVRTTSSILPYENQVVDPIAVSRDLAASAVLDASFQRAGERLRATARLIEASSGRALWSGKVDVRFEDVFEVQDQVARGIVDALSARLATAREGRVARYHPSPEVYRLVMRALEAYRLGTIAGMRDAIAGLEQAVDLDPRYAGAWARLGSAYMMMIDGGLDSDPVWYEKADQALSRARGLDPADGEVRFLAGARHLVGGRKREAYHDFSAALAAMPNASDVHGHFSYLFRLCDMWDEATDTALRARDLDPSTPWNYTRLARLEAWRGDHEAALQWVEQAKNRFGTTPRLAGIEVVLLIRRGLHEEALRLFDSLDPLRRDESDMGGYLAMSYLRTGDRLRAEQVIQGYMPFARVDMDNAAVAAAYWAQAGDPGRAFEMLDLAAGLGNDVLRNYERYEAFEPIRSDPRWGVFIDGVRRRVAEYRREFRWPIDLTPG